MRLSVSMMIIWDRRPDWRFRRAGRVRTGRGDFVMAGLDRDAKAVQFLLDVGHVRQHQRRDGAK